MSPATRKFSKKLNVSESKVKKIEFDLQNSEKQVQKLHSKEKRISFEVEVLQNENEILEIELSDSASKLQRKKDRFGAAKLAYEAEKMRADEFEAAYNGKSADCEEMRSLVFDIRQELKEKRNLAREKSESVAE
jgi:chromosome segregation ATPase